MSSSLKHQAIRGVMWSAIERFSVQGVTFILSLIIARFVTPAEYGLVAMLTIFISIANTFTDSGFSNALIQKRSRTQADLSTVFYFNIAVAMAAYATLFFAAPYIARFYDEPQLIILTRWVGLEIVIASLAIVQRTNLTIAVDFKTQAKASLVSALLSGGVGVILAYYGYGVWALVVRVITGALLNTLLLWIFARWRPILTFSRESFRSLFGFGSKLLLSGLLHTIYLNLYSLVIGKFYTPSDVGYFRNSNGIVYFPSTNFTNIITRAIYPMQCRIQDDEQRLADSFIQYIRLSSFLIFPLMVGLSALSAPFVELVLTDKWLPAAELISILSIAYMWYPVMSINNQILNVKGRSDLYLRAEVIKKIIAIAILVITLPYGVRTLCWGVVLYNILDMIIIIYYSKKVIKTGYWQQIVALTPILLLNIAMGCAVYLSVSYLFDTLILKVFGGFIVGVVSYTLLSYIFRVREVREIRNVLSDQGLFSHK